MKVEATSGQNKIVFPVKQVIIKLIGMGLKGMCQSYRNCYDLGNHKNRLLNNLVGHDR